MEVLSSKEAILPTLKLKTKAKSFNVLCSLLFRKGMFTNHSLIRKLIHVLFIYSLVGTINLQQLKGKIYLEPSSVIFKTSIYIVNVYTVDRPSYS